VQDDYHDDDEDEDDDDDELTQGRKVGPDTNQTLSTCNIHSSIHVA
jgi:hypothetical protein